VPLEGRGTVRCLASTANTRKASVEAEYQRKTPIEHVLLRPGMYVGSIEKVKEERFVCAKGNSFELKEIQFVPGLLKLFDEILVNAMDNVMRSETTSSIKVLIDKKNGLFQIENDGRGIPVVLHPKENMYVPELVLGHLLTGSNFDDTVERFTGGRHGYGAKLTNIMSKRFTVETLDTESGKHFSLTWRDHMEPSPEGAIVKDVDATSFEAEFGRPYKDFTSITFEPDLDLFKMKSIGPGTAALMKRRVYDAAGYVASKGVTVTLNNTPIKIDSFATYAAKLSGLQKSDLVSYSTPNLDLVVCGSPKAEQFVQLSFINGMATDRGGSHVDAVVDQISNYLVEQARTGKLRGTEAKLTTKMVRRNLGVFLNMNVPNPVFDSQMKDRLTTTLDSKTLRLPDAVLKRIAKRTDIMDRIVAFALAREKASLVKSVKTKSSRRQLLSIPKLEDANKAGTAESSACTLVLTEGDSAKSLAVAGLSVVGRDHYGVFPLRGKLLNVRDAPSRTIGKNAEVTNLCAILGLQLDKKYTTDASVKSLRYGKVMLMTDQDVDGSHIKGLIINLFHHFWPDLLKRKGFLCEFVTPLIKASDGRGKTLSFYSMPDFEAWREQQELGSKWTTKYYKGLGTSTAAEAREYFRELGKHTLVFTWHTDRKSSANTHEDPGDLIGMAFAKSRAAERKSWILKSQKKGTALEAVDHSAEVLSITDFVNKELVLYSQQDVIRSIPSLVDGLKVSQRKVLFAAFERKLNGKEMKVGQLAGFCSEHTAYHHGEVSLQGTIINMAQDYVGASNLPLLVPSGQFGTRLQGGKDAASARYIFTSLRPYARLLFPEVDDAILTRNIDDGQEVEPVTFIPVIPYVLVNGQEGIGTGWSTLIPMHNPLDVIDNMRRKIKGRPMQYMMPWVRGFTGEIKAKKPKDYTAGFTTTGTALLKKKEIEISELPVGTWTEDFKERLAGLVEENQITNFEEHHSENKVLFKLYATAAKLENVMKKLPQLRFTTNINTTNIHMLGADGAIKRYDSPLQVIEDFYPVRLEAYQKRRELLLEDMSRKCLKLENELRFTKDVTEKTVVLAGRAKADVVKELLTFGYAPRNSFDPSYSDSPEKAFNYLLDSPVWHLTLEHQLDLDAKLKKHKEKLQGLEESTPEQLWEADLDALEAEIKRAFP